MQVNPNDIFEREYILSFLEQAIKEKEKRLSHLLGLKPKYIETKIYTYLEKESREQFLMKIWELKNKDETDDLERSIKKMRYLYQKTSNPSQINQKWANLYDHAKQVRIERVVRDLLKVNNLKYNINCPFHKEKTGSLKINLDTNTFYCFGCLEKGSPIDFVMKYKNMSFKEAVEFLEFY